MAKVIDNRGEIEDCRTGRILKLLQAPTRIEKKDGRRWWVEAQIKSMIGTILQVRYEQYPLNDHTTERSGRTCKS